jgi:hypothetical protein
MGDVDMRHPLQSQRHDGMPPDRVTAALFLGGSVIVVASLLYALFQALGAM